MIKILVRVIFFYLFISCVYAQDKDLQSWHNLEFGYNPVSDLSLAVNNGIRFVDDVSDVSRYFFDINIKRKHSNLLSYSVGYRYLLDFNTSDNVDNIRRKKRWYLDTYLKPLFFKKIKFLSRTRFQSQTSEADNYVLKRNKFRQKCKFLYDFKKFNLDVFLSFEAFYYLTPNSIKGDFEKLRYQIGCRKRVSKRTRLSLSYMIQKDLLNSDLFFVVRSKLSHDF